MLMALVDTDS